MCDNAPIAQNFHLKLLVVIVSQHILFLNINFINTLLLKAETSKFVVRCVHEELLID